MPSKTRVYRDIEEALDEVKQEATPEQRKPLAVLDRAIKQARALDSQVRDQLSGAATARTDAQRRTDAAERELGQLKRDLEQVKSQLRTAEGRNRAILERLGMQEERHAAERAEAAEQLERANALVHVASFPERLKNIQAAYLQLREANQSYTDLGPHFGRAIDVVGGVGFCCAVAERTGKVSLRMREALDRVEQALLALDTTALREANYAAHALREAIRASREASPKKRCK